MASCARTTTHREAKKSPAKLLPDGACRISGLEAQQPRLRAIALLVAGFRLSFADRLPRRVALDNLLARFTRIFAAISDGFSQLARIAGCPNL